MQLILAAILIGIVVSIITAIKWLVTKAQGKKWKDVRPAEDPLMPSTSKHGTEGNIIWQAEKFAGSKNWNLSIFNKDRIYPKYTLQEISSWEDLIEARDEIMEKIKDLKEGENWLDVEPPENIMENKSTKQFGHEEGNITWKIWKASGTWKLIIEKRGFLRSTPLCFREADTWEEIVHKKNKMLEQERTKEKT